MHPQELKHILRMDKPSQHLVWMAQSNKLDPELAILSSIPQDKNNHPEGNVFIHTIMVMDQAVEISHREGLSEFEHAVLVLSAMCHDLGKATHTQIHEDGRITAFGHPEAGVIPAQALLTRAKVSEMVISWVLPMVAHHMAYIGFYTPDITTRVVRRLSRRVMPATLDMLALVIESDMSGRGGKYYRSGLPQRMKDILHVAETMYQTPEKYPDHLLSGDDIMEITGITPSPLLGKVKDALYKAQLEGRFTTKLEAIHFLLHNVRIEHNS